MSSLTKALVRPGEIDRRFSCPDCAWDTDTERFARGLGESTPTPAAYVTWLGGVTTPEWRSI